MKTKALAMMAATFILATISCTKDRLSGIERGNGIHVVVSSPSVQTKAGASCEDGRFIGIYPLDGFGDESLSIAVYEFDNNELPKDISGKFEPNTRGTVINTSRINQSGQKFMMNAWLESSNRAAGDASDYHFMKDATATCDGSAWNLSCASPEDENWNKWRNNVPTNFWAVYPASLGGGLGTITMSWPADDASDTDQKTLSFDYSMPAPRLDFRDAENQQDLCFAYSRKARKADVDGDDNNVNVDFNHALSAVYFNVSGVLSSISVSKIGFNNVPSSAHCEMTGTLGVSDGNPGALTISWTGQSGLSEYRQAYQSSDFDAGKSLKFDESGKVFMLIPGALDADTELWAEFVVNGTAVQKSVNISKSGNGENVVWKPGKRYLYKLVFNGANDFDFHFNETGNPVVSTRNFAKTLNAVTMNVPVVSAALDAENVKVGDVDWYIKEVIRQGDTTTVNSESFDSSIGKGYSATRSGNTLVVTAEAWSSIFRGGHDYWVNQNPVRTDDLGWSPADWSDKGVIDLSRLDFQMEDTGASMTTANCYIIRHAGTYKLPLVYGNGVVNGYDNIRSYAPSYVGGAGSSNFLSPFLNHLDQDITSPFIENVSGCTAYGCKVIWQDTAQMIDDIQLVGTSSGSYDKDNVRYLQFTVPQDKICQNNAIVAITDANGDVIWSWHIWLTNDPDLITDQIDSEDGVQAWYPMKNKDGNIYNFFPITCLGFIRDTEYPARENIKITLEQKSNSIPRKTITLTVRQPAQSGGISSGCFYQFGRKDPMSRTNHLSDSNSSRVVEAPVSLGTAIKNPGVFYNVNNDSYPWCETSYANLWSGGFAGIYRLDEYPIEQGHDGLFKTVYDPSPRGYTLPASAAYSNCNTGRYDNKSSFNITGEYDMGYYFNTGKEPSTVFFYGAGCRYATGAVMDIGGAGYYLSSQCGGLGQGWYFYFSSSRMASTLTTTAKAFSARPVREIQ